MSIFLKPEEAVKWHAVHNSCNPASAGRTTR